MFFISWVMRKTVFIIISIVYHDSYLPSIIIIIIIAIFVLFLVYFSKKSFLVLFLPLQLVYDLFEIKLSFNQTIILEKLFKFSFVRYYFMWWWKILNYNKSNEDDYRLEGEIIPSLSLNNINLIENKSNGNENFTHLNWPPRNS